MSNEISSYFNIEISSSVTPTLKSLQREFISETFLEMLVVGKMYSWMFLIYLSNSILKIHHQCFSINYHVKS